VDAVANWWKLLVAGAIGLAAVVMITTITGELGDRAWLVAMLAFLASLTAIVGGAVLGVVRLGVHRRDASG
jgi:hypothetical protein